MIMFLNLCTESKRLMISCLSELEKNQVDIKEHISHRIHIQY